MERDPKLTTTNKAIMVGESALKTSQSYQNHETVQDVGYSSESSAQLSNDEDRSTGYSPVRCLIEEAERMVRKDLVEDKWNEVDSSCDASGEYTTNESDSDESGTSRNLKIKLTATRSCGGSVETVVPTTEEKLQDWKRPKRSKKRGRPRSMMELYRCNSLDVPYFRSEVELNALISPTLSCNRSISGILPPYPRLKPDHLLQRSFTSNTLSQWSDNNMRARKTSSSSCSSKDHKSSSGSRPTYLPLRKYSSVSVTSKIEHLPVEDNLSDTDLDVTLKAPISTTEDLSSISDQVWDGYQDPLYLSEPYSELTVDEDDFKKVTEYGDDYCDVIGVISDNSSKSTKEKNEKPPLTKCRVSSSSSSPQSQNSQMPDSDSEVEELHHIMHETRRALQFAKTTLKDNYLKDCLPPPSARAELIATCNTHLHCLQVIGDHLQRGEGSGQFTKRDLKEIQSLIKQWEMIQNNVEQPEEETDDQKNEELVNKLENVRQTMKSLKQNCDPPHSSFDQLESRIEALQMSLCALQETREQLLAINLQVRRSVTSSLRENVTGLYEEWDEVYEHNNSQLTDLQTVRNQWIDYRNRYKKIKTILGQGDDEDQEEKYDVEKELKELHKTADELKGQLDGEEAWQTIANELKELDEEATRLQEEEIFEDTTSEQEPLTYPEKKKSPSMFWRVIRVAVPIQLALVMLYCIACLLEPHCCDFVNNFNFSLTPQLHYVRGPPPV